MPKPKPMYLPDIQETVIDGQKMICTSGFSSMLCNDATERILGNTQLAKMMILDLANRNGRTGVRAMIKQAKRDDQAMAALLQTVKVLLDLSVEKAMEE
jgi:hypothetical protein